MLEQERNNSYLRARRLSMSEEQTGMHSLSVKSALLSFKFDSIYLLKQIYVYPNHLKMGVAYEIVTVLWA